MYFRRCSSHVLATPDGTDDFAKPYSSWIARSSSKLCTAGLRRLGISGTKREEVTGHIRKFHDKRLNIIHPLISGKLN